MSHRSRRWKKLENWKSSDPKSRSKNQRLSLLNTVVSAYNFSVVLLRLMFPGEYKCKLEIVGILISQLPCEKLGLDSWLMKDHLVKEMPGRDEVRLPANSQHQGSRHGRGHLGCSSPSSCPADTMCNRVEPSLLSLAWTPDPQHGQKHDWCFKLLEQTNEKWHDPTAHHKAKHAFSRHLFVVHEFLHVDLFDCLFYLLLLEREAWKFTGNRVFCSVRTQLIKHL